MLEITVLIFFHAFPTARSCSHRWNLAPVGGGLSNRVVNVFLGGRNVMGFRGIGQRGVAETLKATLGSLKTQILKVFRWKQRLQGLNDEAKNNITWVKFVKIDVEGLKITVEVTPTWF